MSSPNPTSATTDLGGLVFTNSFSATLPADPEAEVWPRGVLNAAFSRVKPQATSGPKLVAYSQEAAGLIGLSDADCTSETFLQAVSGNRLLAGMDPYAMCYGGHQFGSWAGQLGDGRAINLGEVAHEGEHWTLQLKGAGPTPYSRHADGLAVLRSSVREFLCSEAMHHLGVPTTRALSLVLTGDEVLRDMFYDGNAKNEPGAVVCRMARSFVRFGNFELPASRNDVELLRKLADFTITQNFPQLAKEASEITPDTYVEWFKVVSRSTAKMIVDWMRVGFVHGVMNTDNMSILGETIDYGPYGWLEGYEPMWTPNTTDAQGRRYCFGAQPEIGHWNLSRLASALLPLVGSSEPLQEALGVYPEAFTTGWKEMMAGKLGLRELSGADDEALNESLFEVLQLVETDMTLFFRGLADVGVESIEADGELPESLLDAFYVKDKPTPEVRTRVREWIERYRARVRLDGTPDAERRTRMNAVNPRYVLRNYLAQLAIDRAEKGDFEGVSDLLEVLRKPYEDQPGRDEFAAKRPDWARDRPGCSMLSCSS